MVARRWLVALLAAAAAVSFAATAPQASAVSPAVINGTPHPAWAQSAVVIKSPEGVCGGTLLTANIIVTAAHCVVAHGTTPAPALGDFAVYPPGVDVNQVEPVEVSIVQVFYDPNYHPDTGPVAWDIAYLVANRSAGTPIVTRNATEAEAVAIGGAANTLTTAGYGQTTGGPHAPWSPIPNGLQQVVTNPRYTGGPGVITLTGDPSSGTCYGDSGGPWMAQIGTETLLVGVTSNESGPPCDTVAGPAITHIAVTAGRPDLEAVARTYAAPYVQSPGTTCLLSFNHGPTCWPGSAWTTTYCYTGAYVSVEYFDGTSWKQFGSDSGRRSKRCPAGRRYLITVKGTQPVGSSVIRIYQPAQAHVAYPTSEQYTLTAT